MIVLSYYSLLMSETLVIIGSGKGMLPIQHQANYAVIL